MTDIVDGLARDQHDFGMKNGHAPVADRVACIDFDATIVPWGPLMADKEPFEGVPVAIRALKAAGYRIVIFTSRLSPTWLASANPDTYDGLKPTVENQIEYVTSILEANDIPFDLITAEKVPAEVYFDDKAVGVRKDWPLERAIAAFLGLTPDVPRPATGLRSPVPPRRPA